MGGAGERGGWPPWSLPSCRTGARGDSNGRKQPIQSSLARPARTAGGAGSRRIGTPGRPGQSLAHTLQVGGRPAGGPVRRGRGGGGRREALEFGCSPAARLPACYPPRAAAAATHTHSTSPPAQNHVLRAAPASDAALFRESAIVVVGGGGWRERGRVGEAKSKCERGGERALPSLSHALLFSFFERHPRPPLSLSREEHTTMSFFSRVMNHLLNEVLVNGLANR